MLNTKLNTLYEENIAASNQVIQDAYTHIALLSPPNFPDFIFLGSALDYIYNPLLTVEECNATPPHSPFPYALLELAEEALCRQCLDKEDGSPLPSLQYLPHNVFIPDEEIPVEELPPPQVFTPVAVIPSPAPESPVLRRGPTSTILCVVEPAVLLPHQPFNESPVIPTYNEADLYPYLFSAPPCTADTCSHPVTLQVGRKVV